MLTDKSDKSITPVIGGVNNPFIDNDVDLCHRLLEANLVSFKLALDYPFVVVVLMKLSLRN